MKAPSINRTSQGFSTLELIIALSLMVIIMTGAVSAISSAHYWLITSQVAQEAMYKNKIIIERLISESTFDFQIVSSTQEVVSIDSSAPSDQSCLTGGLCYRTKTTVSDISSCAKAVTVDVSWKLGLRYATSTISTRTFISNSKEISNRGGDCLVRPPAGGWGMTAPLVARVVNQLPQGQTAIDVLGEYAYVTSNLSPYLKIFKISDDTTAMPFLVSSSSEGGVRLNDIDVIRDYKTGRIYAYVAQHSTSSQLGVYDVTEPSNPQLVSQLPLLDVPSNGSFPQGWRVFAYGSQLFVVSRETTGPELHIFSITNPRVPTELTSAVINLNRTVNDMVVRDSVLAGITKRFLYVAASSDLKEVGVYDVSGGVPIEVAAINLSGAADAISIFLTGNKLYVGRKSSVAAELYVFNAEKLSQGVLDLQASSEVGADVLSVGGSGQVLYLGTSRNGEELQIWDSEVSQWSTSVVNAGRLFSLNSPRLAPLGVDTYGNNLYVISSSLTQPENISVMYTP